MTKLTTTRLIRADIKTVWAQVENLILIENWHPSVATADQLSEDPTGLGATRRCNFYDGTDVIEEIIALDEGRMLKLDIRELNAPMKHMQSTWELRETPSGGTQLSITMEYSMKFSVFGNILDAVMIKGRMPQLLNRVMAGLDQHLQTGEIIDKSFHEAA